MKLVARLVASGGGLGFAPYAAGTFGTLAGIPVALAVDAAARAAPLLASAAILAVVALAVWSAGKVAADAQLKDPSFVVIDDDTEDEA